MGNNFYPYKAVIVPETCTGNAFLQGCSHLSMSEKVGTTYCGIFSRHFPIEYAPDAICNGNILQRYCVYAVINVLCDFVKISFFRK